MKSGAGAEGSAEEMERGYNRETAGGGGRGEARKAGGAPEKTRFLCK